MANEIEIYEAKYLSGRGQALPVPLLAKQVISTGGSASDPFNRGTCYVRIKAISEARVQIGADPDGLSDTIHLATGEYQDFEVIAGHKVIAVAA